MKRIFFAVRIEPEEFLNQVIQSFRRSLDDEKIRWVEPVNFHITLAFPGDTEEEKIEIASSLVKEKCNGFGEFEFSLKGTGVFKNFNDPRVIWIGVKDPEKLKRLNELVNSSARNAGLHIEERAFNPHLTIGRLKTLKSHGKLKCILDKYQDAEIQKVAITEIILYESILKSDGPLYVPLSRFGIG